MRSLDVEHGDSERPAVRSRPADRDAALIAAVGDGDMTAAAELVARHSDRIFAIGFRMLGDRSLAEDLTQDVFFKVWNSAGKWEPGRALFSTWLHRVAINLCYDQLRKRREVKIDDFPGTVLDTPDPGPGAFDALAEKTMGARVTAAILTLPERQRAAITLCHIEGFTNIETADILETTVEAVESLLTRGRKKLRERLQDERQELNGGSEVDHG